MVIDLTFLNLDNELIFLLLKILGGFLLLVLFWGLLYVIIHWFWLPSRQQKFLSSVSYTLLAIDIPKDNNQTPKAVEHIFATLSGIKSGGNLYDKYWLGKVQLSISIELVSIEGYIQFLVYTPEQFRDLVEAAFYAQYPDAEITEVEDYTRIIPDNFPHDVYELWGSDIILGKDEAYPIRTYPYFEHSLSQELKDPLAALLEEMSRLGPGEYLFLQWILTPVDNGWQKRAERLVKKLIGEKVDPDKDWAYYIIYPFISFMKWLGDVLIISSEGSAISKGASSGDAPNKVQYLTPGQKEVVQGIEMKMSKIGFKVKGRMIYMARRDVFNKAKGVAAIWGAISQFNTLHMNFFTKDKPTVTTADYFRVEKRVAKKQRAIAQAFKDRDPNFGSPPYVLNIEELATIYHFPDVSIKAPLLKTTESKRSEPPFKLPTYTEALEQVTEIREDDNYKQKSRPQTKGNKVKVTDNDNKGTVKAELQEVIQKEQSVHKQEVKVVTDDDKGKDEPPQPPTAHTAGPPPNLPV